MQDILGSLKEMKNPQIAFHLQPYCASTCLVSHLLRSTPPELLKTSVSSLDTISRESFAAIHDIPLNYLQRDKFSWTQASLPIRHVGLGIIPASSIAEAAYAGSVIDTSDLASKLTTGIKEKHPYGLDEMILEEVERTQDIHRLSDSCSLTGLLVRESHGLRQTQRILSQGIHAAISDRLFSSLKKARRSAEGSSSFVSGIGSK